MASGSGGRGTLGAVSAAGALYLVGPVPAALWGGVGPTDFWEPMFFPAWTSGWWIGGVVFSLVVLLAGRRMLDRATVRGAVISLAAAVVVYVAVPVVGVCGAAPSVVAALDGAGALLSLNLAYFFGIWIAVLVYAPVVGAGWRAAWASGASPQ